MLHRQDDALPQRGAQQPPIGDGRKGPGSPTMEGQSGGPMTDGPQRPATCPCPAAVQLTYGSRLEVVFWLLPDPARPGGFMPLATLLDGPRTFLAVGLTGGGSVLLSRDAVLTAELD